MKMNTILKRIICTTLILSCFSSTFAKDKDKDDDKDHKKKAHSKKAKEAPGPAIVRRPAAGPPGKPAVAPARGGAAPYPKVARHSGPRIVAPVRVPAVVLSIRPRQEILHRRPAPSVAVGRGAAVQRALQERGFYRGQVDGLIGPMSVRAIMTFQSEAGLPPTGEIDSPLLLALRL